MSSRPKYTVTYFNFRWLAEPIRLILTLVGEEFEDVRVSWEGWEKNEVKKELYPYKKLPCLEERGENGAIVLSQSFAILRYLSAKYNLDGATPLETAKADEYADCIKDMLKEVEQLMETDDATKAKNKAPLLEKTFPRYFSVIEAELLEKKKSSANGGKFGLPLVGKDLTWVDILLAHFTDIFEQFLIEQYDLKDKDGRPTLLDDYPTIKEHQVMVFSLDKIKTWIEKRPVTPY